MAFKLTKADEQRRTTTVVDLHKAAQKLQIVVESANAQLAKLREELSEAFRVYNETLAVAAGFRDAIVAQVKEDFSNKSEKWQEGGRGSKVQEWISSWNDLDLDELEPPEIEEIEVPECNHAYDLEEAPDEPETT